MAQIGKDKKRYILGRFNTEEAAAIAFDKKAIELYGKYARLNFPFAPHTSSVQMIIDIKEVAPSSVSGEIWNDIPEWEGYYQASSLGRIKSLQRCVTINKNGGSHLKRIDEKILKACPNEAGRLMVVLVRPNKRRGYTVHRLIGKTFLPNPLNLPEINHINTIYTDNRVVNLEWSTQEDNILHAIKYGKIGRKRELHPRAKITEEDAYFIRLLFRTGLFSQQHIANIYDLPQTSISMIVLGKSWNKHLLRS